MADFDIRGVREDFPILSKKIEGNQLVYFDNAATSQRPRQVIDGIKYFYENINANPIRSIHRLAEEANEAYESARGKIAKFINAYPDEIVFVKNATEAINLVSFALPFDKGDHILTTYLEHHSNLIPWLRLRDKGVGVDLVDIDQNFELDMGGFNSVSEGTKLVAFTHGSNVTGTITDAERISKLAHDSGAMVLIDAAQTVPHMKIDVKKINPDFLAFSGHKMLGPFGIGVLYVNRRVFGREKPFLTGGEMISNVKMDSIKYADMPGFFEAGTQNIEGAYGLGLAVDYLNSIGMDRIAAHDKELTDYLYDGVKGIDGVHVYSGRSHERGPILSFTVKNAHSHDVAYLLNKKGIAVRSGFQCAQPLVEDKLHAVGGTARASLYLYNTQEEIDRFLSELKNITKMYG